MSAFKICPQCSTEYPANERFCPRDGTALRSQGAETDLVGTIIADRYHVMKKLGEGGMGQVYLAEHVKMGRKSAVKVMNPGMVKDVDAISRFNREAANASRINHPNVAGIYDFGETPEGIIYLAMEFIEGQSLTSLIEKQGGAGLAPIRAAEITRQAADGLSVAHDMGIVHRDLKPDNIMIAKTRDGGDLVKVVDFGIAKAAGAESQKVTKTGLVVGTPEYMSPEQLSGEVLDARSDIYSLGLVAYNMLTGTLPFPSDSAQEAMIMRLIEKPKPLAEMKPSVSWPANVQAVMDKVLERDAKLRYQSAAEFGRELWQAVEQMPATKIVEAGTMVMGSAAASAALAGAKGDAKTAAMPATRVASAADRASAGVSTPAPAAPVTKSKMPIFVGGGVVLAAAAVFGIMQISGGPKTADPGTPPAPVVGKGDTTGAGRGTTPATPPGNPSGPPATPSQTAGRAAGGAAGASAAMTAEKQLAILERQSDIESGSRASADSALKGANNFAFPASPAQLTGLEFVKASAYVVLSEIDKACPILKSISAKVAGTRYERRVTAALASCPPQHSP